jgi:hypothetical protein
MHHVFWNCLYGRYEVLGADNQEMELKRSRQAKIDMQNT